MPEGSSVGQLWERVRKGRDREEAVLAFCDGAVVDFQTTFSGDSVIQWIPMNHPYASMACQRTLVMLLIMTVKEIYGKAADVEIEHSLGKALYCEFRADHPVLQKDLQQIEDCMHRTVSEGRDIRRIILSKKQALDLLQKKSNQKEAALLEKLPMEELAVYQCGDFMDSYMGPMLPDMNYLTCFKLEPYAPGFLLRFPADGHPHELPPYHEEPLFARVFLEAEKWGRLIGCRNVAELNRAVEHDGAKDLILTAEALHEKKIAHIADMVHERDPAVRMICISGPSSAGKTPFMKRLIVQLRVNGIRPVMISLDDYYRERSADSGETVNFEDLSALDVSLFQETMADLLEGRPVRLPVFDFSSGKRYWRKNPICLDPDQPVMIEGLHAFHPELTRFVPGYQCIHVYLGALTQLALNRHNRISTADTRLLRRLVRDSVFRANTAEMTLSHWGQVREGEERNIFHFQNQADVVFNTALIYELPVLKMRALPLLKLIGRGSPAFSEACRLCQFLEPFEELGDENIPANSILREFIGP